MKKITFLALLAALVLPLGFAACSSDDDDNNNGGGQETTKTSKYDDLKYFQDVITDLDNSGNLLGYHYGKELYKDSDPGHLYIGADTWDEAEKMFRRWLTSDVSITKISSDTNGLQAELTDTLGNKQLTVYLKPSTSETNVAEVTVSDDSKLKYFYQITFMLNDAWPQNAKSGKHWRKGDVLYEGYAVSIEERLNEKDFPLTWVCIRAGTNGNKPVFVAVTNHSEYKCGSSTLRPAYHNIRTSRYCPNKSEAAQLDSLLIKDWDLFVAAMSEAGATTLSKDGYYWYDWNDGGSSSHYHAYYYYTGEDYKSGASTFFYVDAESAPFLLYFDWYEDDEVHDDMSIDADYNNSDDD